MNIKSLMTYFLLATLLLGCGHKPKKKLKVEKIDKSSIVDVAKQPIYSTNLIRKKIPENLKNIMVVYQPPKNCSAFTQEIMLLNEALGEDYMDKPDPKRDTFTLNLGQMLSSEVESNIPFNSIIKRLSGARKHEKAMLSAQVRGKARRAYLIGWSDAMQCNPVDETITEKTETKLGVKNEIQ